MADKKKERQRFKVIKTYPANDCMCSVEYEGTIKELSIELNKYTGGVYAWSRRILEKKLYQYEKEHGEIHFEVKSSNTRKWRVIDKNHLK